MTRALGRYELLRPLARGGMAEVYLARRRAAGIEKWLVVKRMRPERTGDPRFLDLFVREARLSMSLVHQNIVPVFDFGRIDEQVFLAMERVEGKDLGSSLARAPTHRIPPLLAAFIAAECCQALDYAHQRKGPDGVALGIVHRDVTPRNVLLSWSGEVKLTDFGIAALAGEATSRLLGTPQYMAPEQARGDAIDPRADIYAIGLVLREAISGARPRPGADRETILDAARRGELVPWSEGEGDEPPAALVAIIERATALAAEDRYPDARSMLEELDGFIVGQRAAHRAESPARQLAAWLATVWEGAREDAAADATIDGEHLVSFLDDGAHDVLGTGTVRSLAATVADEVQLAPAAAPPTTSDVPPAPPEPAPRPARISSSISKIASGSFHTIPTPLDAGPPARQRRATAWFAGVAAVIAIGVAAVFVLRPAASPPPAPVDPPPPSAAPPAEPPPAEPAVGVQPTAGPPTAPPRRTGANSPPSGQPAPGRPRGEHASAQPERPKTGPPPAPHSPAPAPGEGSAAAAPDPDRPKPALCRVRINLTPWAYYTADDDTTRHETPGTIDLAPGLHRLHVWNPELHIERDITINVPADRETMNYSEPLQPSSLPHDGGPR